MFTFIQIRHFCLALTIIGALSTSAPGQTYKYFQIYDASHLCYLGAGKSFDGRVYHYESNDLGDYTQWRFVPAGGGYYYILDRRHGRALSSDNMFLLFIPRTPGHVEDYSGRNNCMWKAETAPTIGAHWLKDSKYGLSLIAGDEYDGHVYIQEPGERSNAQWIVKLALDGDIGPDFYVAEQELLSLTLDTTALNRFEVAPLFAVDQVVSNGTDAEQTTSIDVRKSETTTEKYSFTRSIKVSIAVTIQSSVGVKGVAEVSSSVQTTYEESFSWTSEVEKSKTSEYVWTIPVTVPAHSAINVTATVRKFTVSLPFTAVIRSTMGDGTLRIDTIPGTWNGVDYLTGSVEYDEVTGVGNVTAVLPTEYRLYPAYPNPFNPGTTIRFALPSRSHISLKIYDGLGCEVATLVDGFVGPGFKGVKFDASGLASGIYYYRLQAGKYSGTKKLLLLK